MRKPAGVRETTDCRYSVTSIRETRRSRLQYRVAPGVHPRKVLASERCFIEIISNCLGREEWPRNAVGIEFGEFFQGFGFSAQKLAQISCEPLVSMNVRHDSGESDTRGGFRRVK